VQQSGGFQQMEHEKGPKKPPKKRRKIAGAVEVVSGLVEGTVSPGHSTPVELLRSQLHPVLSDEETRGVTLEQAIGAAIENPKQTSTILEFLSQHFPLKELDHLKRIKREQTNDGPKLLVLICGAKQFDEMPLEQRKALMDGQGLKTTVIYVPKFVPKSQAQLNEAKNIWPVYCLDIKPTTPPSTEVFADEDLINLKNSMLIAIEEAKKAKANNELPIGAVIINKQKTLVAKTGDCRKASPLKHAIMLCIAKVAKKRFGALS